MDNHPIPQDVTHFQFKLIGEMTIKQFAYIAAGAILCWIFIAAPIYILLKLPLIGIFGGTGLLFAFIPIEGRPADLMLTYFLKALFTPDRYIFQKTGGNFDTAVLNKSPMVAIPTNVRPQVAPIPRSTQVQTIQRTRNQPISTSVQDIQKKPNSPLNPLPRPILITTPVYDNEQNTSVIKQTNRNIPLMPKQSVINPISSNITPSIPKIQTVPDAFQISQPPVSIQSTQNTQQTIPVSKPEDDILKQQLNQTRSEKQRLEQELLTLKKQLELQKTQQSPQPEQASAQSIKTVSQIKKVSPPPIATKAPVMPEFPNLITGVVKDSRGNVLPNILIEVKDKDNNPVRAFKTTQLGQFASATSLLNGTYTILFEDPTKQHKFGALEITATGEVLPPIEMISVDEREELRKELFKS